MTWETGKRRQTRGEAACVRYELFRSVEDPLKFVLVEEWRSQAGLVAYDPRHRSTTGRGSTNDSGVSRQLAALELQPLKLQRLRFLPRMLRRLPFGFDGGKRSPPP